MSGIVRSIGKTFSRIDGKQFATGLAVAAGAYYLGGMATGSFADGVAPGGGDESAGLNMNPESTSTMDTSGSNGFGGTTPLPVPSQEVSDMATPPDSVQPGAFDADGTPNYTSPPSATIPPPAPPPPPVQAAPVPAPVQSTPAPETPTPAGPSAPSPAGAVTAQTSSPVKDLSTVSSPKTPSLPQGSSVGEWFKSLSPAGQAAIAGSVAGGAGAVMNAIAAKNAQEFAEAREQRARDDVIRRGAVSAFADGGIKPKRGIINSVRGQ